MAEKQTFNQSIYTCQLRSLYIWDDRIQEIKGQRTLKKTLTSLEFHIYNSSSWFKDFVTVKSVLW